MIAVIALPFWTTSFPLSIALKAVLFNTRNKLCRICSRSTNPMIFKIGYTHNPVWRWTNRLYGYVLDKHKYTNMVVMYQSDECRGPAMLEACLIDIYRSFLVWLRSHFPQYVKPMIHSAIFWGTGPSKSLTMFWISWVLGSTRQAWLQERKIWRRQRCHSILRKQLQLRVCGV